MSAAVQKIPQADLIERWENVLRVLNALPEHDRQTHWDMGQWGRKTECGTVACAAGHCGLDHWFRERGFQMDFDRRGEGEISEVRTFFGVEGSRRIFLDSSRRSVETVIDEVRSYIGDRQLEATLAERVGAPTFGEVWEGKGGLFAGILRGTEGAPDYVLIAGPALEGRLDWNDAMAWAARLNVDGLFDFTLPSRAELLRLADTVPELFEARCYWSGEMHAALGGCAWGQYFDYGVQGLWYKGFKLRARAVRRILIP